MQNELELDRSLSRRMTTFREIRRGLSRLYLEDPRPSLVGFSGAEASTMLAPLTFDVVLSVPAKQRKKEVTVVYADTRVEISGIGEAPFVLRTVLVNTVLTLAR